MTRATDTAMPEPQPDDAGRDRIEDRLRETVRATIEALFDDELAAYLGRIRYGRGGGARKGYRHGRRERELVGTFGTETVSVPGARIEGEDGGITEWRPRAPRRYQRLTKRAEALIAAVYLAGTNTRRVKRALFDLFQVAVGIRHCRSDQCRNMAHRGQPRLAQGEDRLGRTGSTRGLADEDIVRFAHSL